MLTLSQRCSDQLCWFFVLLGCMLLKGVWSIHLHMCGVRIFEIPLNNAIQYNTATNYTIEFEQMNQHWYDSIGKTLWASPR